MSGSTLGCVTATEQPAPSRTGGVALDARDLTRCRRRIHLDHDPDAVGLPRALPDPALEQRRADAARHRAGVAAVIRRETGCFVGPGRCRCRAGHGRGRRRGRGADLGCAPARRARHPARAGRSARARARGRVRAGRRGAAPDHRSGGGRGHVVAARGRGRARRRSIGRGASAPTRGISCGWPTCTGCCGAAGWAPERAAPHGGWGGVIGFDADVVVWHDLWSGHWPGGRSTFAEYDERVADRMAVATAAARAGARAGPAVADHRVPPLPVVAHLRGGAHPRAGREPGRARRGGGRAAGRGHHHRGRAGGAGSAGRAAGAGRAGGRHDRAGPGVAAGSARRAAGAAGAGAARRRRGRRRHGELRRVRRLPLGRAARLPRRPPRGRRAARLPRVRHVGSAADARRGALVRGVLGVAVRACGRGPPRPAAASPPTATTRRPRTAGCSRRRSASADGPGSRRSRRWRSSSRDPAWVDIYAVVDEWFLCAHGKGLKRIAPAAGFGWRDPEAGGENSMRWYRDAVGLDGAPPDPRSGSGCWSTTPTTSPPPTPCGCG